MLRPIANLFPILSFKMSNSFGLLEFSLLSTQIQKTVLKLIYRYISLSGVIMSFSLEAENSLLIWWDKTLNIINPVLPIVIQSPLKLSINELEFYQISLQKASMRLQTHLFPKMAGAIQAQVIAILCHLQTSCAAMQAEELAEAKTYYRMAKIEWIVLQAILAKHGVSLASLQ